MSRGSSGRGETPFKFWTPGDDRTDGVGTVCFCSHVAFLFEGPPTLFLFHPSIESHHVLVAHPRASEDVQCRSYGKIHLAASDTGHGLKIIEGLRAAGIRGREWS